DRVLYLDANFVRRVAVQSQRGLASIDADILKERVRPHDRGFPRFGRQADFIDASAVVDRGVHEEPERSLRLADSVRDTDLRWRPRARGDVPGERKNDR